MTQRNAIKRLVLKALLKMDGTPLRESSVYDSIKIGISPTPTDGEIKVAVQELEADKFITGAADQLDGEISWALTPKGTIRAQQLP